MISDMVAISSFFPGLKTFFVKTLHVKEPDMKMYVQELADKATKSTLTIDGAKILILEIGRSNPVDEALEKLHDVTFVPVKGADRVVRLSPPTSVFAINDRDTLRTEFEGVSVLTLPVFAMKLQRLLATRDLV